MTIKELRLKSNNELNKMLSDTHDQLREMRFKVAQRQLKKVSDIKKNKKLVAKILTVLKEKRSEKF